MIIAGHGGITFLKIGVICEIFHSFATTHCLKDALKRQANLPQIEGAHSLSITLVILSGPGDVFFLRRLIA